VRVILVLVSILFVIAACGGAGGSGSAPTTSRGPVTADNTNITAITPEYVASLPKKQAAAAVDSLVDHYVALANARCADPNPCLGNQFTASFDPAGQFVPLCKVQEDPKEYQVCLLVAPEIVPMITAIGGNPATDLDWSDLDSTNNEARRLFAEFIVNKRCGQQRACIVEQAAALLDLSPAVAASCKLRGPLSDQLQCISDAKSAALYQQAIKSMS
jgi:hypothetical protein